jgi:hypothetical protein
MPEEKGHLTLENLTERWHGINESILLDSSSKKSVLDLISKRPDSEEMTTFPSFISSSTKLNLVNYLLL